MSTSPETRRIPKCIWCLRSEVPRSDWEQKRLGSDEYAPLCNRCANKRLKVTDWTGALIPLRRIQESEEK